MTDEPIAHALTLPGVLERAALDHPDAPALVGEHGALTYQELFSVARRTAAYLVDLGVHRGDRVAIWLPNGLDWAIAAYGVLCAGAVVVPLNIRYTVAEAADILGRAGCAVAVAHGSFQGRDLGRAAAAAGAPAVVGSDRPRASRDPAGTAAATAAATAAGTETGPRAGDDEVDRRMRALTPGDISHVQYTSGTTGRPKGALLRHGAMVSTTRAWVEITGLRAGDRYPVVAPFSHIGGHKTGLLACAVAGATALPRTTLDVPGLSREIAEDGVTFLQGPPTMYQALLDRIRPSREPARLDVDAPSRPAGAATVRVAVTGAASVPPALIRDLRTVLGVRTVFTAYGLTEASGVCTMTRAGDAVDVVAETAGRAIPGVEVRIDGAGAEAGAGAVPGAPGGRSGPGEILVRGQGLMAGYLDDPAATAEALRDGWLRTGDVGVLDEAGRLRVVDRLKDVVIVGGLNVYPAEVERVLLEHPAVRRAAVVGVAHPRLGEVPVAFVVAAPGVAEADLVDFCRAGLAGFKVPRSIWRVTDLPVNAAGKIAKSGLRLDAARRASAAAP